MPERDPGALVGALDSLLANAEACRDMGQAARRRAETELTSNAVAGRYRLAYEQGLTTWDL